MTGPNGDPDPIDTPINVRVSIVGDLVLVTFQTKRDLAAGTLYAIPIRGTRQGRAVLLHDQGLLAPEVAPAHRADTPDVAQNYTSMTGRVMLGEFGEEHSYVGQQKARLAAARATFSDGTVATPQDLPFLPKVLTPLPVDLGPPPLICDQDGCFADAVAHMTWPGSPPKPICANHVERARGIAAAMGFALQVEDL